MICGGVVLFFRKESLKKYRNIEEEGIVLAERDI
jgi:hypothetical protein